MVSKRTKKLTRREFLKAAAGVGGLAAAGGLVSACAPAPTPAPPTPTSAPGVTPPPAAAPTTPPTPAGPPTTPLYMKVWSYRPDIWEQNMKVFNERYNENAVFEVVTGARYHDVMETKFIVGEKVDVAITEPAYPNRWYHAGWIRDLEGLPGLDEALAPIPPVNLDEIRSTDGKTLGLPYYTVVTSFQYNQVLLDKAGLDLPTTLEEWLEQCRKLKADGISEKPMLFPFEQTWSGVPWTTYTLFHSEGEPVWDKDFNPVFEGGGVAFKKVLEFLQTLWTEKLVPEDIMARIDYPTLMGSGAFVFGIIGTHHIRRVNDPQAGPAAGQIQIAPRIPGPQGTSVMNTEMYIMGATTSDPLRAWELLRFCGSKDKEGRFYVQESFWNAGMLGQLYTEFMEKPETREIGSQYCNFDNFLSQWKNTTTRPVIKQLWYPEFETYYDAQMQECMIGKATADKTIENLATAAKEMKAKYQAA